MLIKKRKKKQIMFYIASHLGKMSKLICVFNNIFYRVIKTQVFSLNQYLLKL